MRHAITITALAVASSLALVASGCASDPFCGDGRANLELGEQCDDANQDETDFCLNDCTLRPVPQLTLKWEFNQDLDREFQGDSCFDLGAEKVIIRLVGPGVDQTDEIDCSTRQIRYQDLTSGMYTASLRVTGLDEDEQVVELLNMPYEQVLVFSGGTAEEQIVVVPPALWSTAYVGSFFFRLGWGELGDSCELAAPNVVDNSLLLRINGTPYPGQTDMGHPVDGTAFSPCRPLSEGSAQAVLDVPFGNAEFTVSGRDSVGTVVFEETFETFVGAGINNPELRFNVAILPGLDAGPDASAAQ